MSKAVRKDQVFGYDSADAAVAAVLDRLHRISGEETVRLSKAVGRVFAEPVITDRPSPACDVSAMDGYAVRLIEVQDGASTLPIVGEAAVGMPPPPMPHGSVLRIFTGAPVPSGCDAVVPREEVEERPEAIVVPADLTVKPGQHIRRCGENGNAGEVVVEAGTAVTPAVAAALAAFGLAQVRVFPRVRVAAIVTGSEVQSVESPQPAYAPLVPWQLRDSNGPALAALFSQPTWIDWRGITNAPDDRDLLERRVADALADSDALLITGGVSMGDYDFVPDVLASLGCAVVFHKLPIRPGKPVLAAVGPRGQAVVALPGNPVSVMITARRIAAPLLRRRAGFAVPESPTASVTLTNADDRHLPLHWSRLVRLVDDGSAELLPTQGSGDIIAAARADGFVEIPAGAAGAGPWPFFHWSLQA